MSNSHPNAHPTAGAYSNSAQIAASIQLVGVRAAVRSVGLARHFGMLLETRIKARASGRPGPRAVTGDYRRSWTTDVTSDGSSVTATVGTDKPQGRRLEFGFVGADRIGRVYDQAPYPHVGPAVAETQPEFEAGMAELADWAD